MLVMGNSSIGTKIVIIRTPQSECMLNKQPDPYLEYSLFFSEGWDEDDKKTVMPVNGCKFKMAHQELNRR